MAFQVKKFQSNSAHRLPSEMWPAHSHTPSTSVHLASAVTASSSGGMADRKYHVAYAFRIQDIIELWLPLEGAPNMNLWTL